jgi:hypothetical protein
MMKVFPLSVASSQTAKKVAQKGEVMSLATHIFGANPDPALVKWALEENITGKDVHEDDIPDLIEDSSDSDSDSDCEPDNSDLPSLCSLLSPCSESSCTVKS